MHSIPRKEWVAKGRFPQFIPMGKLLLPLLYTAFLLTQSACGNPGPEQVFEQAQAAAADTATVDQAIGLYTSFLEQFPEHQLCAQAVKELAVLAQQREEVQTAIGYYEQLLRDYPDSEYADDAQFMIAFIYEEYLGDIERARQAYQLVIDKYPDSELASSARHLLPYVGQAPEEWVEFQDGDSAP